MSQQQKKTGKPNLVPAEKTPELLQIMRNFQTTIHTGEEEGFEYLEGAGVCIETDNPAGGEPLFLDLEDGFTLTFGEWEAFYEASDEDYELLCRDLEELLADRMYTAVIYCRDEWICSLTMEGVKIQPSVLKKELREFLHSADCDEFIRLIEEKGAGAHCSYWTGGKKTVRIRPGEFS